MAFRAEDASAPHRRRALRAALALTLALAPGCGAVRGPLAAQRAEPESEASRKDAVCGADRAEEPAEIDVRTLFPVPAGGKVAGVEVRGQRRFPEESILSVVTTRPGEAVDPAKLREDARRIHGTGVFDDVRVELSRSDGAFVVRFVVVEKRRVGRIFLSGVSAVEEKNLRRALHLAEGDLLERSEIEHGGSHIREVYRWHGHRAASARTQVRALDEDTADVCVVVSEGERTTIEELVFEGIETLSAEELAKLVETEGGKVNAPGGIFREELLARDLLRITEAYDDRGFVAASVGPAAVTESEDGRKLSVRIVVREGAVHRIRALHIQGDLAAPEAKYRELFGLTPGAVFGRSAVMEGLRRIQALHVERGQKDLDAWIEPQVDWKALAVDLTIRVGVRAPEPHVAPPP